MKQLKSIDRSAQTSIISSIRKKYSIDDFEKSLALFFISLIGEYSGSARDQIEASIEANTPKLTIHEVNLQPKDIQGQSTSTFSHIPLEWLYKQAGGRDAFNAIASGGHADVASFLNSCRNESDVLYLNTQSQVVTIDGTKDQHHHQSPCEMKNQPEIVWPHVSLLERNESAVKRIWDDEEIEDNESSANEDQQDKFQDDSQITTKRFGVEEGREELDPNSMVSHQKMSSPVKSISKRTIEPVFSSRKRRFFSEDEITSLVEGYERFGPKWTLILDSYPFSGRSPVDLKDKIRNLKKSGLLTVIEKERVKL